jgi:hypothetical protein
MESFEQSIDTYSANYDKLLKKVLSQIDKELFALSVVTNKLSANDRMSYLISNRQKIIDRLRNGTVDSFTTATKGAYAAAFNESDKLYKGIKGIPFLETDLKIFTLVRQGALEEMAYYANIDGQNLFNQLVQYNLTGNKAILEKGLLGNLDELRVAKSGSTIVETNIMTFSRTVNGARGINAGINTYRYDGPDDIITRPFCKEHIDKTYTLEEINEMDNGQTSDVFFTGGGWNCRHRWTPIQ